MSDNPFTKLAPFIQEHIYSHGWTELRSVQVEACRVIFDTNAHLLLATGTASGKTEAAFLPILTLLHQNPPATIGVLYIGPLKALINDQFLRLNDLLKEADIPVWHWHGDVSQSHKNKLLKDPKGILQITPESLESLLINKSIELPRMFGDLRFVIIDEVHVFMGSDRGRQVLCQLQRLNRFVHGSLRRVGLSATLGDYSLAEAWLQSGTDNAVITPKASHEQRRIRIAVEHFYVQSLGNADRNNATKHTAQPEIAWNDDVGEETTSPYYRYIFENSKSRKCLIFANNRAETESLIANLRQVQEAERLPDIYHVHHGSISATLREAAENAMRDPFAPAVTAATVTMELGIDIGQLERVIQLGSPFSVSSFLQRLGRSGRRGSPSEMWFVCSEVAPVAKDILPAQTPWELLQCIAIIQLYLEERWIEPIRPARYPFSLLYHQAMSALAASGELSPAALAQRVLTLPPFRDVPSDDFREMLVHLVSLDHIQQTEGRGLIIGLTGERIVNNFRFYAVFPDNEEYVVREESREIGSIIMPPPEGERFALAGHTWEVLDIDPKRKTVFVRQVKGRAGVSWHGGGGSIHTRILQRIRQVLRENTEYSYLQPGARERLRQARELARHTRMAEENVLPLGGNSYCILPWIGTVGFRTLERCLRVLGNRWVNITNISGFSPYFIVLQLAKGSGEDVRRGLVELAAQDISEDDLVGSEEVPCLQKYDEFVPRCLLRKAFAYDHLDLPELRSVLTEW